MKNRLFISTLLWLVASIAVIAILLLGVWLFGNLSSLDLIDLYLLILMSSTLGYILVRVIMKMLDKIDSEARFYLKAESIELDIRRATSVTALRLIFDHRMPVLEQMVSDDNINHQHKLFDLYDLIQSRIYELES